MKKAFITGTTGQDGSYLVELLLARGYEVHGLIRRASTFNTSRIDHLYTDPHQAGTRLFLHYGDLSDASQITNVIYNIQPDEIYHLEVGCPHFSTTYNERLPAFTTGCLTSVTWFSSWYLLANSIGVT